jgi:hypothetical protein
MQVPVWICSYNNEHGKLLFDQSHPRRVELLFEKILHHFLQPVARDRIPTFADARCARLLPLT